MTSAVLASGLAIVAPFSVTAANAVAGSDFHPDDIISNEVMYYTGSMTEAQIQLFLNAHATHCTSGALCVNQYRMTTANKPADSFCSGYTGAANETAARIIYRTAQSCGVNPQVIIVTLEKEESIITGSPSAATYRKAMGYGCPDSSVCDSQYYGFFNQVWAAAKSFQRPPTSRYTVGVPTTVLYNPNSACGAKSMTIKNRATARLYVYTPYTPDAAALANLMGTGDACSAYGNRNFWRIFNAWFGSTTIPQTAISLVDALYTDLLGRAPSNDEVAAIAHNQTFASTGSRIKLAKTILASQAFRAVIVNQSFKIVFNRDATPHEIAFWTHAMIRGYVPSDGMIGRLMGTTEYFRATGGTNATYVNALYQSLLGRPADPRAIASWGRYAQRHGIRAVAALIWMSPERSTQRAVTLFETYLGRAPWSAADATYWAAKIRRYGYYSIVVSWLASGEYLDRASNRFPLTGS